MRDIYERGLHVLCDCTGNALMFMRKIESGFVLVNHPIKGIHAKNCLLATNVSGEINTSINNGCRDHEKIMVFNLHDENKDNDEQIVGQASLGKKSKNSVSSKNKIHNLLMQLLLESFNHTFYKTKKINLMASLALLRKAANEISFGNSTLDKYIFYGEKGGVMAGQALLAKKWNGPKYRHVFILEVVESIKLVNKNCLIFNEKDEIYYSRIVRSGNQNSSGPFLIMSSLIINEGELYRHTCVIKPVVSNHVLMPVDSDYERRAALEMIKLIKHSTEKITLTKPIKPKISDDNELLLPDFFINLKSGSSVVNTFIIEVMGYEGEKYLKRKERLIPKMKQAWKASKVIEVKGGNAASEIKINWPFA